MSAAQQIRAADPAQSVFVTANAGSGKTTTLVNRVARLLLEGASPGAILCVTYTKAAAAEMQARLFETLGKWAVMDDDALSIELAKLDDGDPLGIGSERLSQARRMFAGALETPGGLKIQTIHAFCEKLLRRFPLEAGVSPRFTVLEDTAAVALSHGAREDLARAALRDAAGPVGEAYSYFAVALDWGRFEALLAMIEAQREPLMAYVEAVEAGEARGPHRVVGADPNRTPDQIEADYLRFLDVAAWKRVAEAMARGSANDQKCAAVMGRLAPPTWSFDGVGEVFLTTAGEPRKSMATKQAPAFAATWLADAQLAYLAVREELRSARIADETVKVLTLAVAHAAYYEQAKAARGALDFCDLVSRTVDLLTRRATAAWVLYKLDGGIDHVLVDEAQDTAPDQWEIVRALTGEFFSGAGPVGRTVFAVGDEKQSIYSFQGARPERLLEETQYYDAAVRGAGAGFEVVPLETSYRSTEAVLGFVDALFQSPERARALTPERGDIPRHLASRVGQVGCVETWDLFRDEPVEPKDAWDAPVDAEPAQSARKQLAARLAAEIRDQVRRGVAVHDRNTSALRPCGYGDFLILVRRRDAVFEEIIRALKQAGVPVAGADRLKLSSHIVFDDLIALARFALFTDDDLSLAGVLRSPFCDIDEGSLFDLAQGRPGSLWSTLKRRADERPVWARARAMLQAALDGRDRTPFAFFAGLLNRVDDTGASGRGRILAQLGREAEEAIDETLNQVLAAEDRGASDLESALAALETADVEVKRELEGARAEVRVMTVHGAKGLEAPVVILPDTTVKAKPQGPSLMRTEDGEWLMCPSSAKDDCAASAEARGLRLFKTEAESLRLLYVALTRARDRLIVLGRCSATGAPDEGSWWSVIDETMQRLGDEVRAIDGDPARRRFGEDPTILGPGAALTTEPSPLPDWARQAPAADPAMRWASPSRLGDAAKVSAPSPLARSVGGGLGRYRRGDLIHRLLERLPDIPPADRPAAAERMLSREPDLTGDHRAEMIAAAFGVLDDARFAAVFGPGSRAEVALAGGAPELPRGVAVSGRLDRLVVTPDRVLVIDYKTNRPAPDRAEEADPAYVLQMAVYVAVLKRLYPDRPVEAALVWTDGPKLTHVPQSLMDAALMAAR